MQHHLLSSFFQRTLIGQILHEHVSLFHILFDEKSKLKSNERQRNGRINQWNECALKVRQIQISYTLNEDLRRMQLPSIAMIAMIAMYAMYTSSSSSFVHNSIMMMMLSWSHLILRT